MTERLVLRPLCAQDLPGLQTLYGDPDLMRLITGAPRTLMQTTARLSAHLGDHARYGFGLCAASFRDGGDMIGRCGLEPKETGEGLEGALAWMFHRRFWGLGLGTEAARALIEHGLASLNLNRVFATADHRNTRSIAIMKTIGMTFVAATPRGVEYELRP